MMKYRMWSLSFLHVCVNFWDGGGCCKWMHAWRNTHTTEQPNEFCLLFFFFEHNEMSNIRLYDLSENKHIILKLLLTNVALLIWKIRVTWGKNNINNSSNGCSFHDRKSKVTALWSNMNWPQLDGKGLFWVQVNMIVNWFFS